MYKGLMSSAVFALLAFLLSDASAQEWPTKSIRFVVPFAPGGTSEIVARSVAQELTKQLGQTVYVENKPGGAGTIAMQEVAGARTGWLHDHSGPRRHARRQSVRDEEASV